MTCLQVVTHISIYGSELIFAFSSLLELGVIRRVEFVLHISHIEVGHSHFVSCSLNEEFIVYSHGPESRVVMMVG